MLYLLLLFLILLMLLTLMILDKDIFSPSFIVCAVFFLSTLGCIVNARYWKTEISMATILVIVGGCLVFSVIGIVCIFKRNIRMGQGKFFKHVTEVGTLCLCRL